MSQPSAVDSGHDDASKRLNEVIRMSSIGGSGMRVIDLEQPRTPAMPIHPSHRPGYYYALHRRHDDGYRPEENGPRSSASGLIVCMEHSGTHIDALCHQADAQVLYGGVAVCGVQTGAGFTRLGVEEIPPIVAPGVLLDAPAGLGVDELEPGRPLAAADLQAFCARQGVSIDPGDVVLVRTGNARSWSDTERYLAGPGMDGSAARWLAERRVLAVGADNMAWDVIGLVDPELGLLPGHLHLIARRGIYIIENLLLEELAAAGVSRFTFVCTPLKFVGATGSPVRPIALVSADDGARVSEKE
jgi:kynurenine formamidase